MKKKLLTLIMFISIIFLCSGCGDDKLESSNILTTVYPIEYLVTRLYGENANISSMYPDDTDINEYTLSDKQLKSYAKNTNIFIYNGLSNEKDIAKTLLNKNKKLNIIDVSYGLKYKYGIEELWLNPNNYLMLANTIKKDIEELSSSKYVIAKIEENYAELVEDLTTLDADLRNIAKTATSSGNNTLVIAYDSLGFLENYGFNIINISNENNISTSIKNKFKNKTYKTILVDDAASVSDSVKDIVDNYGVKLVEVNTLNTLTDAERDNGDNYLTITRNFLSELSNLVLK